MLFSTSLCMLTFIKPDGLDTQQKDGYDAAKKAMGWVVLTVNLLFVVVGVALLVTSVVQLVRKILRNQDAVDAATPNGGV
jgi:hypothetical protein